MIPYALFFAYFALDFFLFLNVDSYWLPILLFAIGVLPKGFISAWNHHHQHLATFHSTLLNRLTEVMFGFQCGITSHAWYLHHVRGHHEHYLDQSKDESAWKRKDGTQMGELEYTAVVAATAFPRAYRVGKKFPKAQRWFVGMGVLQIALVAAAFAYNWYNAIWMVALPMATSLWITSWITYYHHRGLDTDDDFKASYNITTPFFNWATGNLGFHTAHHYRQGVHWSKLPELHEKIKDRIPAHCYRNGMLIKGLLDKSRAKQERKRRQRARAADRLPPTPTPTPASPPLDAPALPPVLT